MEVGSSGLALFSTPIPDERELAVVAEIEDLRRQLRHRLAGHPRRWFGSLRRQTEAKAVRASNAIEGIVASDAAAAAIVAGEEPFDTPDDTTTAETRKALDGYRRAMTFVLQVADDPHYRHTPEGIRALQYMVAEPDMGAEPGRWRRKPVFVTDTRTGNAVYEGPDADRVPGLIDALVADLNTPESGPDGRPVHPTVIRAAMAHLDLVMIHPFTDANGRTSRVLQSLVVARDGVLDPPFCSIEEWLGEHTFEYFAVLAAVGGPRFDPTGDARPWVRFVLTAHYNQARRLLRRTIEAAHVWEGLEQLVEQLGLPDRLVHALYDTAVYGLPVRNALYKQAAEVSDAAASRDLARAVTERLLEPHGQRRGRYYTAADELRHAVEGRRETLAARIGPPDATIDPFADPAS